MATLEEIQAYPLTRARDIVGQFQQIQTAADEYNAALMEVANPIIEQEWKKIEDTYEDALESAQSDPEGLVTLQNRIAQEKQAAQVGAMQRASKGLDAQRSQAGLPTSTQIQQERARLEPELEIAQAKVGALRSAGLPSQRGLSSIESADMTLAQRRLEQAQREQNVIKAMLEAEGDPKKEEQFLKNIESISDPRLQDQTINLISRLGFDASRPIQLQQGGSVQPTASQDEGTISQLRQNAQNAVENSITQEQMRLQSFLGGSAQTETPTDPKIEAPAQTTPAPAEGSLPWLINRGAENRSNLVQGVREFVTGQEETTEQQQARVGEATEGGYWNTLGKFVPTVQTVRWIGDRMGFGQGDQPTQNQPEQEIPEVIQNINQRDQQVRRSGLFGMF